MTFGFNPKQILCCQTPGAEATFPFYEHSKGNRAAASASTRFQMHLHCGACFRVDLVLSSKYVIGLNRSAKLCAMSADSHTGPNPKTYLGQ